MRYWKGDHCLALQFLWYGHNEGRSHGWRCLDGENKTSWTTSRPQEPFDICKCERESQYVQVHVCGHVLTEINWISVHLKLNWMTENPIQKSWGLRFSWQWKSLLWSAGLWFSAVCYSATRFCRVTTRKSKIILPSVKICFASTLTPVVHWRASMQKAGGKVTFTRVFYFFTKIANSSM
jgi:hypothetical protein